MYTDPIDKPRPSVTVPALRMRKRNGEKITALTCYDASFAAVLERAELDIALVGGEDAHIAGAGQAAVVEQALQVVEDRLAAVAAQPHAIDEVRARDMQQITGDLGGVEPEEVGGLIAQQGLDLSVRKGGVAHAVTVSFGFWCIGYYEEARYAACPPGYVPREWSITSPATGRPTRSGSKRS